MKTRQTLLLVAATASMLSGCYYYPAYGPAPAVFVPEPVPQVVIPLPVPYAPYYYYDDHYRARHHYRHHRRH
jgi:hypothetical protein